MTTTLRSVLSALPEDARNSLAQHAKRNRRTLEAEAEALCRAHLGGASLADVLADVVCTALRAAGQAA